MYDDESLASHRRPTEAIRSDIRLAVPIPVKSAAARGGIPPMFAADAQVEPLTTGKDALEL